VAFRSFIIRDNKHKFKDLGDVLAIARAEGKKLFKTHKNIYVIHVFFDYLIGWTVIVSLSPLSELYKTLVLSGGEKDE